MVCGMLHGGGKAHKDGVFRLAKGEKVFSPHQLKAMCKGPGCKKTQKQRKKKCGHTCKCKKH
jgi:hypothetical protein